MQGLLLTSSICVCVTYLLANVALGAEVFDSSKTSAGAQDYDQLDKMMPDYQAMINHDLSSTEDQIINGRGKFLFCSSFSILIERIDLV